MPGHSVLNGHSGFAPLQMGSLCRGVGLTGVHLGLPSYQRRLWKGNGVSPASVWEPQRRALLVTSQERAAPRRRGARHCHRVTRISGTMSID